MSFTDALGVFGAVIAAILGILKLREYQQGRTRLDVQCLDAFAADDGPHLYVRIVKHGTRPIYLTSFGIGWLSQVDDWRVNRDFTNGAALRATGEATVLMADRLPSGRFARWRRTRRAGLRSVSFVDPAAQEPRLMTLEGDSVTVKRCARRFAAIVRLFGWPPNVAYATDSFGNVRWAPIPESVRQQLLSEAMEDNTDWQSPACPDPLPGLWAAGPDGVLVPILAGDHLN